MAEVDASLSNRPMADDCRAQFEGILGQGSDWTALVLVIINPALCVGHSDRLGAQVAQLVEHVTENHGVGGSIPPLGTIRKSSTYALSPNNTKIDLGTA